MAWLRSEPFRQSAIISYYAILSLPGLLIMIIWILSNLWTEKEAHGEVITQFKSMTGIKSTVFLENLIQGIHRYTDGQSYMQSIALVILIYGATNLFFQLQKTLNHMWSVEVKEKKGLIRFFFNRLNSMVLIMLVACLLLVSMVSTSILSYFRETLEYLIGGEWTYIFRLSNFVLSFIVLSFLFSIIYKVLPDVQVPWKMVWVGGFITALLFNLGKWGLSYYFSIANPSSDFGTASTAIFIMLWINYSTLIFLFGAQFTNIYGIANHYKIKPRKYARWNNQYVLQHKDNIFNEIFEKKLDALNQLDKKIKNGAYVNPESPGYSSQMIKDLGLENTPLFEKIVQGFKSIPFFKSKK